jgi:hypothetical protein
MFSIHESLAIRFRQVKKLIPVCSRFGVRLRFYNTDCFFCCQIMAKPRNNDIYCKWSPVDKALYMIQLQKMRFSFYYS